ncbi:MAG: CaiB/BaiF CoA-transferase family protein [Pseudomonadota bacterium]
MSRVPGTTHCGGPLHGLRVVEMTGLGPAPLAGQLLADLGGDVIVVDRAAGPSDPTDINRRGKRSIALDLKHADGLDVARRLIGRADVLIEGFRPGVMERLGLGPDACFEANAGLVYARMTGWGQSGPWAARAGHDINYLGLSGALHAMGDPDSPPVPPLNLAADYGGGTLFLLFGVLSALWERARSGRGQVVDAAMVDGVPAMMGLIHQLLARGEWTEQRGANLLDGGAPFYRCYRTADDAYVSVGPLEPPFFAEMLARLGLDDRWQSRQYDRAHWPALEAALAETFASRPRSHWEAVFADGDACVAPVLTFSEAAAHPHNRERSVWHEVDGVPQAAAAPRFSRTPAPPPTAPGAAGGDAEAVLAELGLSSEARRALANNGAVLR